MQKAALFLLISVLFFPLFSKGQNDIREETIYFLMTSRFFDGDTSNNAPTEWCSYFPGNPNNGNYSGSDDITWRGDFKGLVQQLDYIKDLGFTAIWITPIVQNRSPLDYHGYHAWDFTRVDPRLESPGYTFENLVDSVHAHGMKLILDIVLNHAGRFGVKDRAEIKYNTDTTQVWGKNRFGFALQNNLAWEYDGLTPNPDDGKIWSRANLAKMPPPFNQNLSDFNWPSTESYVSTTDNAWYNKSGNGFAQGYDDTLNLYYRALAGDTPDLLTGGDSVRNYLFNAYKRFIDMGIDGLRLDAIKHMPKRDVLYFVDRFKQLNPDLMVFGEVAQLRHELHPVEEVNPHYYTWRGETNNSANSGIGILDFYALGTFHLFNNGSPLAQVKNAARFDDLYSDPGTNILFIDNHDFGPNNDWNKRFEGSAHSLAAAMNFMFTWRGLPCVYYGTEAQFKRGAFTDIHGSNALNSSINSTGRAYFGDDMVNAPNHLVYAQIKKLNAMRSAVPALQKGDWTWGGGSDQNGVGYVRKYQGSEVVVGLAKDASVNFQFTGLTNGTYRDAVTGFETEVTDGTLAFTVSPSSAGIYVLNGPGLIGELGAGFFQKNSNGGGGVPLDVSFDPVNPIPGKTVTVSYEGQLSPSAQMNMHYSFDYWTVGGINDVTMTKNGNKWVVTVAVPSNASINMVAVFNDGGSNWDNNGGIDFQTPIGFDSSSQPHILTYFPAQQATWVPLNPALELDFSESMLKGTGFIKIYQNNQLAYNIDVATSAVGISGTKVRIQHGGFTPESSMRIELPETVFKDGDGNFFKGLGGVNAWTFETGKTNGIRLMEHKVKVYPNPSGGSFVLETSKVDCTVLRIRNAMGQTTPFLCEKRGNQFYIDVPNAANGIYFLELDDEGQHGYVRISLLN